MVASAESVANFLNKVRELLAVAPDNYAREDLVKLAHGVKVRFKLTPEQKESWVLQVIQNGAATFEEIRDESGIRGATELSGILSALRDGKKIRRQDQNQGKKGRPSHLFFSE